MGFFLGNKKRVNGGESVFQVENFNIFYVDQNQIKKWWTIYFQVTIIMLTWAEKPLTHLFCQLSQKPRRQRRCQTLCVILALLSASLHSLYDVDKGLKS